MASTSIVVLEEFLRSGSSQARKNSLMALSVLDNEESAKLMVRTALQDDDTSVRQRALDEIGFLSENAKETALNVIAQGLSSEDQHQQQLSYLILGRFKSMGWEVPKIQIKWGRQMWLAASIYSLIYPQRTWRFRIRSWKPAMFATAIGTLPFIFINYARSTSFTLTPEGVIVNVLSVAIIILAGLVFSVIATQFTTPIYIQLRPFAASIVQILVTLLCTLLVGFIAFMLFIAVSSGVTYDEFFTLLLGVSLVALTPASVRMGTLLPLVRAQFVTITRNRKLNWFIETLFGTIAGFLVAPLVYAKFFSDFYEDYRPAILLAFFAIILGMAYSFAKIDTEVFSYTSLLDSKHQGNTETSNK